MYTIKKYLEEANLLKAVIFDMDGVIIDSEPQHARAAVLALEKYNVPLQVEYAYGFIGTTTLVMCQKMIEDFHLDITPQELWKANEESKAYLIRTEGYPVIPYIIKLMQNLHDNGMKLIIASSSPSAAIESVMKTLKINSIFDGYISGMEMKRPKPAPDIFLAAALQLGVEPSECIVIEDSCHGVAAAEAAGITSVGFINPNSGNQDLSKAAMLVEGFEEVDYNFLQRVYQRAHLEPVTILTSEHCILRELSEEDIDTLCTIYAKPEVNSCLENYSHEPAIEKEKLLSYIKNVYPFYDFGLWGVFLKENHCLIGQCGVDYKHLDTEEVYELSYLLTPEYQGMGYGREIILACITYCFEILALPKIIAVIDPANTKSIQLAECVGMLCTGECMKNHKKYYRYEVINTKL